MVFAVKDNRPINLDLTTIKLPITAYASFPHRITGIILFGAIGFLLWALQQSVASPASFNELKVLLGLPVAKFITWVILSSLLYHFVAGIKHLIMDLGIGESLEGGKVLAVGTMLISGVLIIAAGVWLW